jgi:hypothetical protein
LAKKESLELGKKSMEIAGNFLPKPLPVCFLNYIPSSLCFGQSSIEICFTLWMIFKEERYWNL